MKTLKELWDYREMIASLVRKDLRGRYKGSVLGFLWTFINPLFQLIIYTIVFSVMLRNNIEKFYLFLFVGLVPWIFFSAAMTTGATSVLAQKSLVTKIYFPREVLPIAYVTSSFVNMLYTFIVVFAVIIISPYRVPSPLGLLTLPLVMIVEYMMALGVALIASAVTVYFRDLEHILGIVSMGWMYLTPIMYSADIVPERFKKLFYLNPMSYVIEAYRDILYYGTVPQLKTLIPGALFGLVFVTIGFKVFGVLKKHFAEAM